jgi:hypothetical protein
MSDTQTLADRVKTLTDAHSAEFTRTPQTDGTVVVTLHFPLGDKISGAGATTADAFNHLEARVAAFVAALEA